MIRYTKVIAGFFFACLAVPAGLSAQEKSAYSDPGGYSYNYPGYDSPTMMPLVPQERNTILTRLSTIPHDDSFIKHDF
ncbi:MAG: hypothetical protein QF645_05930, partial [Planctomycetota bacterium]|nr:hypothetical protein [Planctomycetota bacterium]